MAVRGAFHMRIYLLAESYGIPEGASSPNGITYPAASGRKQLELFGLHEAVGAAEHSKTS